MNKIYYGTSGFAGFGKNKYYNNFNTIELNTTFYNIPKKSVWNTWFQETDNNFVFIIKANNFFTHKKKLNIDHQFKKIWNMFWNRCLVLRNKLGPILFQFPSNFKYNEKNINKLQIFADFLKEYRHNYVFEFRDYGFYNSYVYDLFKKNNWCFSILVANNYSRWIKNMPYTNFILPNFILPEITEYIITSNILYVRFHGSKGQYIGKYGKKKINQIIKEINKLLLTEQKTFDVFMIFNNTDSGFVPSAIKDALIVKNIVHDY